MGRARSQTVDGFSAVFGSGRGVALTRAQRDVLETAERARALTIFSELFFELEETEVSADEFVHAYETQTQKELVVDLLRRLHKPVDTTNILRRLQDKKKSEYFDNAPSRGLSTIISLGDPGGAPGLTASAAVALNVFFEDGHQRARTDRDYRVLLTHWMMIPLRTCFSPHLDIEDFRRLQPLCQRMDEILSTFTHYECVQAAALEMAHILKEAPVEAAEAVLASWIDNFAIRYDAGLCGDGEANTLWVLAKECEDDAERSRVFARLCSVCACD